ncbi:hypothetical protein YC2023_071499 [Brassica napus]
MDRCNRLRNHSYCLHRHSSTHLPSAQMVPHLDNVHNRSSPSLLQRLRLRTHILVLSFYLRQNRHFHHRSLSPPRLILCKISKSLRRDQCSLAERLAPLWAVSFLLASSGCSTKPFLTLVKPGQHIPHLTRLVYRNMSILGVEGFSALPKHCLMLCYIFFAAAVFLNGLKDLVGPNWARFTPLRMAMAISFHIGGYFTIYMCVGSLILFIWRKLNGLKADAYSSAVASGLICGEGIWTLPSSVVALAGVKPPICMKFLSGGTNVKWGGRSPNCNYAGDVEAFRLDGRQS